MVWMIVESGVQHGSMLKLEDGSWSIGADIECDVVIHDLPDGSIYQIVVDGKSVRLKDLTPGGDREVEGIEVLTPIALGDVQIRFTIDKPIRKDDRTIVITESSDIVVNQRPNHLVRRLALGGMVVGLGLLLTTGVSQPNVMVRSTPINGMLALAVREMDIHGTLSADDSQGNPVIRGYVSTQSELDAVKSKLHSYWSGPIVYRVKIIAKVANDIRRAISDLGIKVTVEEEGMEIKLNGFIYDPQIHAHFINMIKADLAEPIPIASRIVTKDEIERNIREIIQERNVRSKWRAVISPQAIEIKAYLEDTVDRAAWDEVEAKTRTMDRIIPVSVTRVAIAEIPPIDGLRIDRHPSLILHDGRELGVGSPLSAGQEIVKIERDGILLRVDDVIIKQHYATKPNWITWVEVPR